jgi:hypothetical protein
MVFPRKAKISKKDIIAMTYDKTISFQQCGLVYNFW